jgi:thiosulfate/3-mercaptopyruvate sulfurtransferase
MLKIKNYALNKIYAVHKHRLMVRSQSFAIVFIAIISIGLFVSNVYAGCSCSAVGNWDPTAFLNSDEPGVQAADNGSGTSKATTTGNGAQIAAQPAPGSELFPNGEILKSSRSISSSDIVLDVSNGNSYSRSHIKGALLLPSKRFLNDDGTLKSVSELATILGNAGVSSTDPVVVYGDNPGEAAFAFWVLSYLGQDDVRVLDGSLNDWKAAGLPTDASQSTRPGVEYTPNPNPDLLADYDYVKAGSAQIVDARPFIELSEGRIPNSASLESTKVLMNGKLKDGNGLRDLFSTFSKDRPIVVYSDGYYQMSLLWYALQIMGYESKIYTWADWAAHQPPSGKSETAVTGKEASTTGPYKKLGST